MKALRGAALLASDAILAILLGFLVGHFVVLVRNSFALSMDLRWPSFSPIALLGFFYLIAPGFLLWRFFPVFSNPALRWTGAGAGLAYGSWSLAALILLGYVGGYPNVPILMIKMAVLGDAFSGAAFWLLVYGGNLIGWPAFGYAFAHLFASGHRTGIRSHPSASAS